MLRVSSEVQESVRQIRNLVAALKHTIEGYERTIELMAACAVAGEPLLLLGEPGVGKNMLVTQFFKGMGLPQGPDGYFEKCFHPFLDPSEVYGPWDINRLTQSVNGRGEYVRLVEGYLPSARAAFLDDIFLASPDFLLTTLSILADRIFHNGPFVYRSPLSIVIAASNDLPRHDRLRAVLNRLPIRAVAEEFHNPEALAKVLAKSTRLWCEHLSSHLALGNGKDRSICTFDDFVRCRKALLFKVPDDFTEQPFVKLYTTCLDSLQKHPGGIVVPQQRPSKVAYVVMRALALLRREDPEPHEAEIRVVEHIFSTPEAMGIIQDELNQQRLPEWEYLPETELDMGESITNTLEQTLDSPFQRRHP